MIRFLLMAEPAGIPFPARSIPFPLLGAIAIAALLACGCASQYQAIRIPKDYDFSRNRLIGIYVSPSGFPERDETFGNIISLDLMSRGYHTVVINRLLRAHGDSLTARGADSSAIAWILARSYMPKPDVIAVARPTWDSTMIITYYAERYTLRNFEQFFAGARLPRLRSELAMFDIAAGTTILRQMYTDTCQLYAEKGGTNPSFAEYPWVPEARQVTRAFKEIPVCAVEDTQSAPVHLPVVFYVDRNYRDKFPTEWQARLTRRLVFASDILTKQFGIRLEPDGFIEWNSRYESSLDYMLNKLKGSTSERAKVLQIGVTVDGNLTRFWRRRSLIGAAFPLGIDAVITAQPSFPDVPEWNAIEEALTLVHEVGHLFGAGHSQDEESVMYPVAGPMTYRFDSLNTMIIDGMKHRFLELDEEGRCKEYIRLLSEVKTLPFRNSVAILQPTARAFAQLLRLSIAGFLVERNSIKLDSVMSGLIADSSFRYALSGFIEYKLGNLDEAAMKLRKALSRRPGFAEAHLYLGRVYAEQGNARDADEQRRLALEYGMSWNIDE